MKLDVAAQTDIGQVRHNNEDNYYLSEKAGLFVVADGMGGHASGEVASKLVVDILRDFFQDPETPKPAIGDYWDEVSGETNRLASAIRLANMAIYEAALKNPQYQGMGTTVAAVLVNEKRLSIAHVGDSRVYLIRGSDIEQLTDDHSLVFEQFKRDLITREEAETSEMRNILTRALGTQNTVEVDLSEMTLIPGDILVLCSDGLHGMIPDEDILQVVTGSDNPAEACDRLVEMANERGGRDNITVLVAYTRKNTGWSAFLSKITAWFWR